MGFADEVRNNFRPAPVEKIDSNIYQRIAEKQMTLVKEKLMYLSQHGQVSNKAMGLLGIKKKIIETSVGVSIDTCYHTAMNLSYDGEPCGIGVPNKRELQKVFVEISHLCQLNGINVKHEVSDKYGTHSFHFWIEV